MELKKELIELIENAEFTVSNNGNCFYEFGKFSPANHDFSFTINAGNDMSEFLHNIYTYYDDFDVSGEAYLWLDNFGHGKNGAPHDMKDVYEDFEICREYIDELYKIVNGYMDSKGEEND